MLGRPDRAPTAMNSVPVHSWSSRARTTRSPLSRHSVERAAELVGEVCQDVELEHQEGGEVGDSMTRSTSKVVELSQPLSLPCW